MPLLLDLYLTYVKISFVSFGGLSMVPLLSQEMLTHGWMTEAEVVDIVAIAEMTPGPLALNCASFVGIRIAGVLGSLFATLGVLTPSLTVAFLAAVFLAKFKDNKTLNHAMYGVRPTALGMIIATIITLSMENYAMGGALYLPTIVIGIIAFVLLLKFKFSIPLTILISAVLGIIFAG